MAKPMPHVVGIGASAGGLDALEQFFRSMPAHDDVAFVVIQHLSPDFKSLMDQLLKRYTSMRILHATRGLALEGGAIYLIAPRTNLQLADGMLHESPPAHGLHFPIDVFFESLAQHEGSRAIGIILSGTGTDGTRGMRAIKEAGGLMMVQDEGTAQFDGMPRSAIATGLADFVLPPSEMPAQLLRYIGHPYVQDPDGATKLLREPTELEAIVDLLLQEKVADFRLYKTGTVTRRIERRMGLHHIEDPAAYIRLLERSAGERSALAKDILIGVTRFFRDPPAWRSLKAELLDRLPLGSDSEPVRLWTLGCSTGEEAYSLAMLVRETLDELGLERRIKLFASDLDSAAIRTASAGAYPENVGPDIGAERLIRFFRPVSDHFEVQRELREIVVFATHDALKDPPFTRVDLITCRNLLIYFKREAQERLLSICHYALQPEGTLFLGLSESTESLPEAFAAVRGSHRVLRKNAAFPVPARRSLFGRGSAFEFIGGSRRGNVPVDDDPVAMADRIRAIDLAPPAVLLTERQRVLRIYGDVSDFVRMPDGDFTADASRLVVAELRASLMAGLHRAARSRSTAVYERLSVPSPNGERCFDLRIDPFAPAGGVGLFHLVSFCERRPALTPPSAVERVPNGDASDGRVLELAQELEHTRESLQIALEEAETSNEELQSTNEELVASNEELQSTNEELQSVNEELHSVNAEYQSKIAELTALSNDFENLLASTGLGTIFVDTRLCIRKFTPAAQRVFHLVASDAGRPITHLTHRLRFDDLVSVLENVIRTRANHVREVELIDGNAWFEARILPFIDERDQVQGAVLTLVDVTELKRSTERMRLAIEASPSSMILVDRSGSIVFANSRVRDLFGHTAEELIGQPIETLVPEATRRDHAEMRATFVREPGRRPMAIGREVAGRRKDGSAFDVEVGLTPIDSPSGVLVLASITDVDARRTAERLLRDTAFHHRLVLDHVPALIASFDRDGRYRMANKAYLDWLGLPSEQIVGRSAAEVLGDSVDALLEPHMKVALSGGTAAFELRLPHRDTERWFAGTFVPQVNEALVVHGIYCFLSDIDARRRAEDTLAEQALVDPLTGALNRRGLERSLADVLAESRRAGGRAAVVMVDVDDLKQINDRLGHATGDVALFELTQRLRQSLRPRDRLARVGGDEFIVLLPETRSAEALMVAEKLRLAVTDSAIFVQGAPLRITASFGVAPLDENALSIEEILTATRPALARGKHAGKNRVAVRDGVLDTGDGALAEVLEFVQQNKPIDLVAQPIVRLADGATVGYEFLARGPAGAFHNPSDFFRLAYEQNVLTSIDLRCLRSAVAVARRMARDLRFHVNLFPSTLLDTPPERLIEAFGDEGLANRFCIEVSEQQLIGDPERLFAVIAELRRAGLAIAIDDVGFGRSSLESLIVLEPEVVKIDKAYVSGVGSGNGNLRRLERLMNVVRHCGAESIAEGIETDPDLERVRALGIGYAQGYLLGRPGPIITPP